MAGLRQHVRLDGHLLGEVAMRIATRQNEDGTYDEVGMNNRAIMPGYSQRWRIVRWAREFGQGRKVRIQSFSGKFDPKPVKTEYIEP